MIRIETDNTVKDGCRVRQLRACLKGRDMRERLYSPDRLKYPMKRVGERGEGRFERISWDEALKTVADKLRETVEKYGNESLYWQYCSGQQSLVNSRRAWWRLLNLCGGYLKYYGSYSTAQISAAFPMTYGASPSSDISEIANAKLYVTFGHNPAVTRGSGHGKSWQMTCTREAEGGRKPKMIVIDPIYSDTAVAHADEWIPIRPGTDAALVEAIAHELIVHDRVDHAFLAQYCVGYDEGTLPASAPKGSDYKSHILGRGPDGIEKTPEWASRITGVPVETIVRLAEEIGTTKPVFFSQGWGPQRQANGEQTSRAIAMLPILTGNVGLPGTSTGQQEGNTAVPAVYLPVGTNPVKATIPCFLWTDAIVRGREMDDVHDGLRGVKTLGHDIKMIVNSGGNTLINQHSDSNRTDEILRDTSKCEFIVVCDNMMTPSARYADILLPDTLGPEADDVTASGGSNGDSAAILPLHKAVEPGSSARPGRSAAASQGISARKRPLPKERPSSSGSNGATTKRAARSRRFPTSRPSGRRGPLTSMIFPTRASRSRRSARTRRPILSKLRRAGSRSTPSALRTSRRTGCFPRATSFRRFRCSCAPGRCRATHCRRSIRSNATVITATAAFTRPSTTCPHFASSSPTRCSSTCSMQMLAASVRATACASSMTAVRSNLWRR